MCCLYCADSQLMWFVMRVRTHTEEKAEARRQRMAEFRQRRAAKKEELKQHKREVRERARERHWMSVARKEVTHSLTRSLTRLQSAEQSAAKQSRALVAM
jgi:hypothetical protein